MEFWGGDTERMRDMSLQMIMGAQRLQESQARIAQVVTQVPWEGPDAEAFRGRITSEVTPRLTTAMEQLSARSQEIAEHASEQDDASDPRGFWEKVNDALHWPAQITRTIRNIEKIASSIPKMLKHFRDGKAGLQTLKDLWALRKEFPKLAWQEYRTIAKEWDTALNGKGWEKLGDFIPQKLSKYLGVNIPGKEWAGKALSHLDEITDATKPWIKVGSKSLGKILPGVDIALGVHQILTGDTYDKVSGSLATAGGALVLLSPLAGPAAPIVAGVGVGLGVVSAGLDIGRALYQNVPVVKSTMDAVGKAAQDTVGKIGDGLKSIGDGFASIFG